jgi:hypothetical protein
MGQEHHLICVVRRDQGLGGAGDYVVSSQAKEHAIVFHKWGKTQPLYKVS